MSRPAMTIRPSVTVSSAPMRFSSVVLPLPDGTEHDDELAASDVERHVLERGDDAGAHLVAAAHAVEVDERALGRRDGLRRFTASVMLGGGHLLRGYAPAATRCPRELRSGAQRSEPVSAGSSS